MSDAAKPVKQQSIRNSKLLQQLRNRETQGSRVNYNGAPLTISTDAIMDKDEGLKRCVILGFTRCGNYLIAYRTHPDTWTLYFQLWLIDTPCRLWCETPLFNQVFDHAFEIEARGSISTHLSITQSASVPESIMLFIVHGRYATASPEGDVHFVMTLADGGEHVPNGVSVLAFKDGVDAKGQSCGILCAENRYYYPAPWMHGSMSRDVQISTRAVNFAFHGAGVQYPFQVSLDHHTVVDYCMLPNASQGNGVALCFLAAGATVQFITFDPTRLANNQSEWCTNHGVVELEAAFVEAAYAFCGPDQYRVVDYEAATISTGVHRYNDPDWHLDKDGVFILAMVEMVPRDDSPVKPCFCQLFYHLAIGSDRPILVQHEVLQKEPSINLSDIFIHRANAWRILNFCVYSQCPVNKAPPYRINNNTVLMEEESLSGINHPLLPLRLTF